MVGGLINGQLLMICVVRFASYLYTTEGRVVTQRVWDETLAELDFAGVRGILESMKG